MKKEQVRRKNDGGGDNDEDDDDEQTDKNFDASKSRLLYIKTKNTKLGA